MYYLMTKGQFGRPKIIINREFLLQLLERYNNATKKTPYTLFQFAKELGISRTRLLKEIKEFSLEINKVNEMTKRNELDRKNVEKECID